MFTVIGALSYLLTVQTVLGGGEFTRENMKIYHHNRPAINPEFDPDYSCLFDVFQTKCIPGSQQECTRPQFGQNEDATCFPMTLVDGEWQWECPDGYHSVDDDETGQCYSDETGCQYEDMVLIERSNRCASLGYLCVENEHMKEEYCIEYCTKPDNWGCIKQDYLNSQ